MHHRVTSLIFGVLAFLPHAVYSSWADDLLSTLSLEQKIGQLCVIATVSDTSLNTLFLLQTPYTCDPAYVERMIRDYEVGGVIYLGVGTLEGECARTQQFQAASRIPLLIAQDFEWGLTMRIQDAIRFPRNMTLGAVQDTARLYDLGKEIGRQALALGVHINLAPVADVNTNPANPIIGSRSFGDSCHAVATKASLVMRGMQDAGILACAKHFPGHGDTAIDSHYELPLITHTRSRLESIELYPFMQLMHNDVATLMTAHVAVPALEPDQHRPASLSRTIVTDLIRTTLGFNGLIITDGLGMKGVTNHYEPGMIEVMALHAGNDILLCPVDLPRAVACIKDALEQGILSYEELDAHVLRILRVKEQYMRDHRESFHPVYHHDTFHTSSAYALKQSFYRDAITIAKDTTQDAYHVTAQEKIALITIGNSRYTDMAAQLYQECQHAHYYQIAATDTELPAIGDRDKVVISLHGISNYASGLGAALDTRYGLNTALIEQLKQLHSRGTPIILALFGSPYSLAMLSECAQTIIVGYEDDPDAQCAVADVIMGRLKARGTLPVKV
jgi:beta-N-acetylhexosaminidase